MLKVDINELIINNKKTLLSNIKFVLENNLVYTILGVNGTGKSTLIKSITGLLDKRFYTVAGSVFFDDRDILKMNGEDILELRRDKIKYVFQDAVNSFDHLKPFRYYFERLAKDLKQTDALLDYFLLPPKEELFRLYPYEVSGGMAQRINFVLALLAHPQIIILDEPTSGIDTAISNLFLLKLKEFARSASNAALLVTHDISFAEKVSDRIAFLNNGRLSEFLPVEEFFKAQCYTELEKFLNSYRQISA